MSPKKKALVKKFLSVGAMSAALLTSSLLTGNNTSKAVTAAPSVSINEIAWMGTTVSYNNEWMELRNNTNQDISLDGWKLKTKDGTPSITLSGVIRANGYFLLERTSDNTVVGVTANQIYVGALGNSSEALEFYDANGNLVDLVSAWYAGDNTTKGTMERISSSVSGDEATNWQTSEAVYDEGLGTPKSSNSISTYTPIGTQQHINQVSNIDGAINVYFNKSANKAFAYDGNEANYNVNLEERLLQRIYEAQESIDMATYEINLPRIINALIQKASEGVTVRIVADAKDSDDPNYVERYQTMRLYLEKFKRGADGVIGTNDDGHIHADSVMFAVEDQALRESFGLPSKPTDIPVVTAMVSSTEYTGHLLADAERKIDGSYYSPGTQMHNKFVRIDDKWVWTGSWNFTETGLYGSIENMENGILNGNQNHSIEIYDLDVVNVYKTEFNEMFGSATSTPDPNVSKFSRRKSDNTVHQVDVNGTLVEIYFSPGENVMDRMQNLVKNEAQHRAYFEIFAWSDQKLADELKYKWEGSYNDMEGTLTGFEVKGLFDPGFYNQWWSPSIDMTQRTASQTSLDNPNTRWNNPAPVYAGKEDRKLHAKTMIIDGNTNSDPTVVIGSTNWSNNGDSINDENMLIIHNDKITNQFVQEFFARYGIAGGQVPTELQYIQ